MERYLDLVVCQVGKSFEPILQPQKFVNWDTLEAWVRDRSISLTPTLLKPLKMEDIGVAQHPKADNYRERLINQLFVET